MGILILCHVRQRGNPFGALATRYPFGFACGPGGVEHHRPVTRIGLDDRVAGVCQPVVKSPGSAHRRIHDRCVRRTRIVFERRQGSNTNAQDPGSQIAPGNSRGRNRLINQRPGRRVIDDIVDLVGLGPPVDRRDHDA